MRRRLLFLLLTCLLASTAATAGDGIFKLYLVRHAEKQADGGRDPALTIAGQQRAERLAHWLEGKGVKDIWSSDYQRTLGTAEPLMTPESNLYLGIYDAGKLTDLAEQLLARANTALVVGHSNTTPELARLLCKCEIADMDEAEYDRLIVININDRAAEVETLNQSDLFRQAPTD